LIHNSTTDTETQRKRKREDEEEEGAITHWEFGKDFTP
jgi:hypothetical protein